ncbi:MAG: mechanosensitive ion channel domain-containing protein [Pseudomonadota bacterium]
MEDTLTVFSFIRVSGLLATVVILIGTWVLGQLLSRFMARLGTRFTQHRLRINQVGAFVRFVLYIAGITIAVMLSFRLSKEMLLAIGGTIAVALGFALKDLTASLIAGLIILVDKPFQVGDRVSFEGFYGEIASIGLRSVRLITLDDNVVTIPNNKFLTEAAASGNAGALEMLIQMDFFIGADQDVARARRIVADALTTTRYAFLEKPWTVLVNQVVHENYFAIRLRAKVYVLDVRYEKALESDVNERVIEGFREAGVSPPAILHRTAGDDGHGPLQGESTAHAARGAGAAQG